MELKEKIYLVKYCGGDYDEYYSTIIFATFNKDFSIKYVKRFNSILNKWKKYYSKYEDERLGFRWIMDEYVEKYFDRWIGLSKVTKCYYEEINIR